MTEGLVTCAACRRLTSVTLSECQRCGVPLKPHRPGTGCLKAFLITIAVLAIVFGTCLVVLFQGLH